MTTEKPNSSTIEKITDLALAITKKYICKEPETIIGVKEEEGEWKVTIEAVERKAVPSTQDLLGRYNIRISKDGKLLGWEQKMVRKRGDRLVPAEEEWVITT